MVSILFDNHFENSQWDNDYLVGGFNPSEQYEFVSWDDEILNIWKIIQMFQNTNQL